MLSFEIELSMPGDPAKMTINQTPLSTWGQLPQGG